MDNRRVRTPSDSVHQLRRVAVEEVATGSLKLNPSNPRKHSRDQIAAIATSIDAFGFNVPILVDAEGWVIAGHGRLEAAKLKGLSKVQIIRLEHLDAHQAKAFMLADNKLTDRSSWDDRGVASALKELSEIAINFEIEATGLETAEIDLRIQSLQEPDDAADVADEFEPATNPPTSSIGDLWILGDHRLYCGDALDPSSYEALLADERAATVFTDPPYNVRIDGHAKGTGARKHREFPMASGEMTSDEFGRFLLDALRLAVTHSIDQATFFACMDWRHMEEIASAIRGVDCALLNLCVWVRRMAASAVSTDPSTNLYSSSARGTRSAQITSGSENTAAIVQTCGIIPG
jgi:ParB-like nuclease domain